MANPPPYVNPNLCAHKLNPAACLQCFHLKPAGPTTAEERDRIRAAAVPAAARSIIGDIKGRPPAVVPPHPIAAAPQPGAATAIAPAQPVPHTPRAGVPMIGDQGALGPTQGGPPPKVMEAYSSATRPESHQYGPNGEWIPPVRKQIIDSAPRHPNPGFQQPSGPVTVVAPTGQQFK